MKYWLSCRLCLVRFLTIMNGIHNDLIRNCAERAWILPNTMHNLMKGFGGGDGELNRTQVRVLSTIHSQQPLTASRLHSITALEKGSLTPIVRKLEENGLITRETDPDDRRRQLLSLTVKGREKSGQLRGIAVSYIKEKLEKMDIKTVEAFSSALDTLSRIAGLLDRKEGSNAQQK